MSEAGVLFEVRELRPGYFTYDVAIRPADGLPVVRQASGATRCEHAAELAAVTAIGLIAIRLAQMGAAPLPVQRVGLSPRDRARRRTGQRIGAAFATLVAAAIVGAVIGCAIVVVDHLAG